jgi:hypothetical protein
MKIAPLRGGQAPLSGQIVKKNTKKVS